MSAQPITKTVTVTVQCQCGADAYYELVVRPQDPTRACRIPPTVYLCSKHFTALFNGRVWPTVHAAPEPT